MSEAREIYCCGCSADVQARLTDGVEIYPHRKDLGGLPFWKCDACGNYVGCHYKSGEPTKPLGNISTPEIRNARNHIHKILDPIWENSRPRKGARAKVYGKLSKHLGYEYHTGEIKSLEEARKVYAWLKQYAKTNNNQLEETI